MRGALACLLLVAACSSGTRPAAVPTQVVTSGPTPSPPSSALPSPSPSAAPSQSPSPSPRAASKPYRWSVHRVTAADLPSSWHAGCPVAPAHLRRLTVTYRDFAGTRRTGQLVVNERVVDDVVAVFGDLYRAGFPIRSMRPVDAYGADDDRSMAADNTSAFNCRDAVGGSGWSQHAYGLAVDVNPRENPYLYGGKVLPPNGAAYADRSRHRRGMTYRGSAVNNAFARQGWTWGGAWRSPDYQHFSTNGK